MGDSGKVNSDASVLVAYAGKPLVSRMQVFWKVLLPLSLANAVVTMALVVANPWWYRLT